MAAPSAPRSRLTGAEYSRRRRAFAAQVLDLYRDGYDLPTIAAELEITLRRATSLFGFALASTPGLNVDQLRGSVEVRLDKLAADARSLANSDDERIRMQALNQLARIEQQRAQLLGLNIKPTTY
jgi:porphobilinogen deaminase